MSNKEESNYEKGLPGIKPTQFGQTFENIRTSHPYVVPRQVVATKLEAYKYIDIGCQFPSLELRSTNMFMKHDNAPVHRLSSMKTWFAKTGVKEIDWPAPPLPSTPLNTLG